MQILQYTTWAFNKPMFYKTNLVLLIAAMLSGCGSNSETNLFQEKQTTPEITKTKQPVVTQVTEAVKKNIVLEPVYLPEDPLFSRQWHLKNSNGCDINVTEVWKRFHGKGVKIAVVDTGIEANHPDLSENIDMNLSFCYENNSSDPSPTKDELSNPFVDVPHGTAVSGIIAALQNDIGVSGVAPEATLVGLNVFSRPEDSVFEDAMLYKGVDISSNSWGNDLSNGLDDDRIVLDAIVQKMQDDPVIYVFASGNESANTNFSSVLNSRYTFPTGAVTMDGKIASYSNFGANVLTVAPGGAAFGDTNIVTTDLTTAEYGYDSYRYEHFDVKGNGDYNYTNQMNGTSAAAPIVSGVIALMLEANHSLDYRDIRDIIIKSSQKTDSAHISWQKNGAGLWFSPYYGFGLINTGKAVAMAEKYKQMPPELTLSKVKKALNIQIPDNDDQGIVIPVEVDKDISIEYAEVTLKTDHTYSGDLKIALESPSGTSSILAYGKTITNDYYLPWTFASLQFYDEHSEGTWKLHVADLSAKNSGQLQEVAITLYGHKK